jgi:hypothetical protein
MDEKDILIDTALDSYPLAPLPPGFIRRTMKQVAPQESLLQLSFLDLSIAVFFVVFTAAVFYIMFWLLNVLNPIWMLEVQAWLQWAALYTSTVPPAWIPLAAAGLIGLLGATVFLIAFTADQLSPKPTPAT